MLLLSCTQYGSAPLSHMQVGAGDPVYTTYCAPLERSTYLLDEGYHLRINDPKLPIEFTTDNAGNLGLALAEEGSFFLNIEDFYSAPEINLSYPDMVKFSCQPMEHLDLNATFVVHSSRLAVLEITLSNRTRFPRQVTLFPYLRHNDQEFTDINIEADRATFVHREKADSWTRNYDIPHVEVVHDLWLAESDLPLITASVEGDIYKSSKSLEPALDMMFSGDSEVLKTSLIASRFTVDMQPFARKTIRIVRGVAVNSEGLSKLRKQADELLAVDLSSYQEKNEELFAHLPKIDGLSDQNRRLYESCWVMMRQQMMPPEGRCPTLYYLFSREPQWGWGHGGQVFHESLTMLAYALFDPNMAMSSQRLYARRQREDGYINYRTGPYLDETIEVDGMPTSSAPWYAWQNLEIWKITRDRQFLEEMYASSKRFYQWYTSHRDTDGDGLCEWGGHGVLESVRDARVAVWDEVTSPDRVEALGLNCMLVKEASSLAEMALTLGLESEAAKWRMEADSRAEMVRDQMWDEETGFFYHIDQVDGDFSISRRDDLKRKEIIGFLPLWAGIATKEQAERLVNEHFLNGKEFWREYGIPSLAANDPYYNPKGYWNGPVWVEWNYLVLRGLIDYGYNEAARELTDRVATGMTQVLAETHNLWEFYSPDEPWGGWHATYIWAGIVNRMMLDVARLP